MCQDNVNSLFNSIAAQFVGTVIKSENGMNSLDLVKESKDKANKHKWLYHCTTTNALFSIITQMEFWLSNLKCVNDKEEAKRINIHEYESTYYVSSFTYEDNVLNEHWREYGSEDDGILIGVKKEWFKQDAVFMTSGGTKCCGHKIFLNRKLCEQKMLSDLLIENRITNPFYINSFDFYQVVYNDYLKRKVCGDGITFQDGKNCPAEFIVPEVAGIIKSCKGECKRNEKETYIKDWCSEKEVRLKVGIQQMRITPSGNPIYDGSIMKWAFFPKIAVPLTNNAFDQVRIRFSPNYSNKSECLRRIEKLLPSSKIEIL
ncbi:MAG: hypothetical protein Q4D04_11060 [Clostridia bacterium]|nr:hypothetical protein [Clostridia bacterium]